MDKENTVTMEISSEILLTLATKQDFLKLDKDLKMWIEELKAIGIGHERRIDAIEKTKRPDDMCVSFLENRVPSIIEDVLTKKKQKRMDVSLWVVRLTNGVVALISLMAGFLFFKLAPVLKELVELLQ
jgi:hypothetical protein